MADFPFRQIGGEFSALQRDVRQATSGLRKDLDADAYAPARPADWAGSPPTTRAEALDRIAYHIVSGGGAAAILELPA